MALEGRQVLARRINWPYRAFYDAGRRVGLEAIASHSCRSVIVGRCDHRAFFRIAWPGGPTGPADRVAAGPAIRRAGTAAGRQPFGVDARLWLEGSSSDLARSEGLHLILLAPKVCVSTVIQL